MRRRKRQPWKRCYKVRIEGRQHGRAFYQAYWTSAVTLGGAIERALIVAAMCGVEDPVARAAEPLPDHLLLAELLDEFVRDLYPQLVELDLLPPRLEQERFPTPTSDVFCGPRCYFPIQARFVAPVGIIESCAARDLTSTRMRPGYARTRRHAGRLRIVASAHQLEPLFADLLGLLRRVGCLTIERVACQRVDLLPNANVGRITHLPKTAYIARTLAMGTAAAVLEFLHEQSDSLVRSGYFRVTAADLRVAGLRVGLDEHKVLRISCGTSVMMRRVERVLLHHGVRPREPVMLLQHFPHYHYRPPGSLGPRAARIMLEREGFRCRGPDEVVAGLRRDALP
jgi:hypothetical protein